VKKKGRIKWRENRRRRVTKKGKSMPQRKLLGGMVCIKKRPEFEEREPAPPKADELSSNGKSRGKKKA